MWTRKLNEGEVHLYKWQYGYLSGFYKHLWAAISTADKANTARLAKGFPEDVEAYHRFATETGFMESVREQFDAGNV
jgi:hypothetical protein